MPAVENGELASRRALLAKIREAKRLADAARWQLLDVVIWLNEVEDDQIAGSREVSGGPRSGLLGIEDDHYVEYDEYQPDDRDVYGGDYS